MPKDQLQGQMVAGFTHVESTNEARRGHVSRANGRRGQWHVVILVSGSARALIMPLLSGQTHTHSYYYWCGAAQVSVGGTIVNNSHKQLLLSGRSDLLTCTGHSYANVTWNKSSTLDKPSMASHTITIPIIYLCTSGVLTFYVLEKAGLQLFIVDSRITKCTIWNIIVESRRKMPPRSLSKLNFEISLLEKFYTVIKYTFDFTFLMLLWNHSKNTVKEYQIIKRH